LGGVPTQLNIVTAYFGYTFYINPMRISRWFKFRKLDVGPHLKPPHLPIAYTMHEYDQFMKEETFLYSASYVQRYVTVHNPEILIDAVRDTGAIATSLHYGSYMLVGGAVNHLLGLPYTALVGFKDLQPKYIREFWHGVGYRSSRLYGQPLFHNHKSPRRPLRWLKTKGNVLGVALDAPVNGRRWRQQPCKYLDSTIYMQTGTARLACIANVPLIPVSIQYDPEKCQHHLYIDEPVFPDKDVHSMTQRVIQKLEKHFARAPKQQNCVTTEVLQQPSTNPLSV